jgi:8-hydroxy-5-deazaflavin:NADPH oxidoreductase
MTDQDAGKKGTVAVLGGTGKEGKGLGYRWAKAGYAVIIGSRQLEKALAAAQELNEKAPGSNVRGMLNSDAASAAELVVMTVPYAAHQATLESISQVVQGKTFIDVTVPLVPPKVTRAQMPPAGSAAMEARQMLGEGVEVASAFQNISYEKLFNDEDVECDVLVCGSSKAARVKALEMVAAAGLTGWDAGPLENSMVAEGLTSILIGINKQYGVQSAGIRVTGVPDRSASGAAGSK